MTAEEPDKHAFSGEQTGEQLDIDAPEAGDGEDDEREFVNPTDKNLDAEPRNVPDEDDAEDDEDDAVEVNTDELNGADPDSGSLGWDDADTAEFTGDVRELSREWVERNYNVKSIEYCDDGFVVELAAGDGSFDVDVPDDPVPENAGVEIGDQSEPVTVGDMRFDLRSSGCGFGDGRAVNMENLWRAFDAFPKTGWALIKSLKDPGETWKDARRMYDEATQSPDTPDKKDARGKVIEALEIEREWMYVTDRSNEDYYDLRCWTPADGWREDAFQVVEQRMSDELGTRSTKTEANHVIHHLANRHPVHSDELDAGDDSRTLIPFSNGVLVLESIELDGDGHMVTGSDEFLDHDPEFRFADRLDAPWDPENAEFTPIDDFMKSIVGGLDLTPTTKETDIRTLWEFAGHSFFPRYHPQGFLLVIGEGGDGKTVWFNLVTEVLGEANVAGATLDAITGDQFSAAEVVDKRANIAADIGGTLKTDISDLKWMTGDDRSQVRPIRKAPFPARNGATMMFGSNSPPAFTEKKRSLKRRLYPVRAPFEFHNDPDPDDPHQKEKIPEDELVADLTTDAGLAAVAVRMVEGAKRLRENDEWTLGQKLDEDERLEFYESEADSMADFSRACIEPDPDGAVALDDLEMAYDGYAVEHDHPSKARNVIKDEIERSRDIQIKRSNPRSWTEDDSRPTVYKGIRFTQEAKEYLPEHAFWGKYDIENPHQDAEDEADESYVPVVTLESGTGRTDDPIRVTVDSRRDNPAYDWDDQGVLRDGTDTIRYKIVEGHTLQEGATYEISKFIPTKFEDARVVQIVTGMTDVVMVEDGSRDDDQEPEEDPDRDASESGEDDESDGEGPSSDIEDLPGDVQAYIEQHPHKSVSAVLGQSNNLDLDDRERVAQALADVRGFDARDEPDRETVENELRDTVEYLAAMKDTNTGAGYEKAVKKVASKLDAARAYVEHVAEKLKRRGDLYEPADGRVRTT